jgi:hypothetical protein
VTLTLNLPPELETELHAEASHLDLSLSEDILHLLSSRQTQSSLTKTGAELVESWQREGIIGSRPDIADSQSMANVPVSGCQ